ncbi:hypothetical protein H5410_011712 [Solanum commersonii]|uniref:Uncharacterized protein n=1 Tax=Solanum commersonii TaxID=4109 RepID=A0A9J6APH2_SOLCO|nr:hypothetical protein H5410_011712 [Solanum commersonii]
MLKRLGNSWPLSCQLAVQGLFGHSERASKIKLSRHDLYVQLSIGKKEIFFLRQRVKNVDSASFCLLVECTKEASCYGVGVDLPRQQALAIRESSSAARKGFFSNSLGSGQLYESLIAIQACLSRWNVCYQILHCWVWAQRKFALDSFWDGKSSAEDLKVVSAESCLKVCDGANQNTSRMQ